MAIIDESFISKAINDWEKAVATRWLKVMLSLIEDDDETAKQALRTAVRAVKDAVYNEQFDERSAT